MKSKPDSGAVSVGFTVEKVDKAVQELQQKGLTFKIHDDKAVKLAYFTDPDGHTLYLCEVKA